MTQNLQVCDETQEYIKTMRFPPIGGQVSHVELPQVS